jgi:signal transduction histidine kinase
VRCGVADHGPGIPEADRGRAVERFVRLEASRTRPGSGLGLSLAAAVATLHGGELRLDDNAPGLRATLILPAAAGDAKAPEPHAPTPS